jgi:periplasmic divalent cation tolerance protein
MTDYIVVLVTASSEEEGEKIAQALVEEKLAACVNVHPAIRSIYRWKGEIASEKEVLLLAKTKGRLFERLKRRVLEIHNYEVPEIIALPVLAGFEPYLGWVSKETL